jgi:GDP/UDP-N,N'-diacetylbacillosamine 2-epimerase (hydrolysing)
MTKRKVCVITGTRAEYGLLYWLIKEIESDQELTLQLIATGMHLMSQFGLTYKEIEKEFKINKKINILSSSDTDKDISKSMGLAQISFAETFEELSPDIIVVLGDRYEIFSAVAAGMIARIPIAHIHGGESSEGAIDEAIRHSITKMSHLHFTASEEYKNRVIQLGEHPERVFNVGGMGIENINRLELLSKDEFEKSLNFKLNKKNILITFHPTTLENKTSKTQFKELLDAVDDLDDTNIILTKSNSDSGGKIINKMIDDYVVQNNHKTVGFASLGQLRYLSAMQYIDAIVGNSSSGLIEAPSFKIGTINIGDRQKGRIKADSVIDCLPDKESIRNAFNILYSKKFQSGLETIQNPYDQGNSSKNVIKVLKTNPLDSILKKSFYNLNF